MILKFVCLCCVTAYIIAAPIKDEDSVERQQSAVIPIISLSAEYVADGKYKFNYETGNGIKREETAYDKESPEGKSHSDCSNEGGEDDDSGEIHVQKGSYSYTAPDGTLVSVRYIADENGFQPIITEVSHSGSQITEDLSQHISQSDYGKMSKEKTTDDIKREHNNESNEQNKPKISKNIEQKQDNLEDQINLKFGDKLMKSGKIIKEEPSKQDDSHDKEKKVSVEKGKEKSKNPTNNDKSNKNNSIINKELLTAVENSASKKGKTSTPDDQTSNAKKETPIKVVNAAIDNKNNEHVPDQEDEKPRNDTLNPSQNKDKSKESSDTSFQGTETDNEEPKEKKEQSDKLKEDLEPKNETLKTENTNDKQKNISETISKPNTKPLETDKKSTKVEQQKEANSTNSKIKDEKQSEHEANIPEKNNITSLQTKAMVSKNTPTGGEQPIKVVNSTIDNKNNEHVPDQEDEKPKNDTLNPSQNKDKSKENSDTSYQGTETDNEEPKAKKEQSDKLKEDLEPKNETLKTENTNDKQKNISETILKPNTKPLETDKKSTKVEQQKEANSTNSKIKDEKESEHETNIPEKNNITSLQTKAMVYNNTPTGGEHASKNDIPKNITENPHETKNISAKTEKKPLESEIEPDKNIIKTKLSSGKPKTQVTEEKVKSPELESGRLEKALTSPEAEEKLDIDQKNKTKPYLTGGEEKLTNNKNMLSNKNSKLLPKEELKIANETKKPENGTNESRIQSPDNKEKKTDMRETNTDDNIEKSDKEQVKRNKDKYHNQNRKETTVNLTHHLPNKNNNDGVHQNIEEKSAKLDKKLTNNNNITENIRTNEDMTNNESTPKSVSGSQMNPKEESARKKEEKFDRRTNSKDMGEKKSPSNKEEKNIYKKNETLKHDKSVTHNTENPLLLTELSNGTHTTNILSEVQKPVKEAEKHEKVAETAAKKAVKAAEKAENAADTAQKAAKDTEAIINTLNQPGNHSRELAINAAIKHAKLAGDAAKEAIQAAEMADIAADNAKNAAQAAEKVVELVKSSSNTKNIKELISNAGDAVKDAKQSASDAVHAVKDATEQSESVPKNELLNSKTNISIDI